MAGLIVIDFIDMDEARNNAAVERRLKEALKKDRARIQIGKISGFGLMEMSRQRLHSSFLESSYKVCPHCGGKGMIRSVESSAMHALHILEEAAARNTKTTLLLSVPLPVAEYVLNVKRSTLNTIESRYQVRLQVQSDASLLKASDFRLERLRENGVKVSVQLPMGTPFRNDKNSEKAQSIDAIIKATREEVQENETTTNREHNRHHHKKDWKRKQKQLAAEQAALNEQRHEIEESAEQQPLQDKEHFTVVEQTTLTETEDMQSEKKSGKGKYRDRKKKKQKQFDKPETKTENLPAVHTDYVPAKVEETPLPTVVENDSKQEKRGGWWNRLMG
jgi:ribonuclease E